MTGKTRIVAFILSIATIILVVLAFSSMEEGIEVEALLMVAKAFSVWLFVPFVDFLEYLKRSDESIHSSRGITRRKFVLSVLSVGLVVLCAVNLIGEVRLISDVGSLIVILAIWLPPPMWNFFRGIWTTNGKSTRMSLAIAVYYFSWMLFYALNGSTSNREGAQHMHIYLAPFAMAMLCPVVIYAEFCARRTATWLRSRNETALDSG